MRHALLALALAPLAAQAQVEQGPPNAPYEPAWATQTRAPALPATAATAAPFSQGTLDRAWGIASLPDGTFLVTEKAGRLRLMGADGVLSGPIAGLPEVDPRGQGGLLDVAVGPDFATSRAVFWTYSKPMGGGLVATAMARGTLSADGTALAEVRDLFVQDPPSDSTKHYGSRVVPLPDGTLAVTTGEHSDAPGRERAQDPSATWGKVVRVTPEGGALADNPFAEGGNPLVWTLGHRNVQGAALDAQGRLWTIEHGPLGGDELNLIERGANYGWPVVSYGLNYDGSPVGSGEPRAEGFREPAYYWDPVIAPGNLTFYRGEAFPGWEGDAVIASLKVGGLTRLALDGDRVTGEERLLQELGRVRDVEELPDGSLLLLLDAEGAPVMRVTPG